MTLMRATAGTSGALVLPVAGALESTMDQCGAGTTKCKGLYYEFPYRDATSPSPSPAPPLEATMPLTRMSPESADYLPRIRTTIGTGVLS